MWKKIKRFLSIKKKKELWRKQNIHNYTRIADDVDCDSVTVGNYTYGEINVEASNVGGHLYIGNFCSIGPRVTFILNSEHRIDTISTYPFKVLCTQTEAHESFSKGDIIVGDDVWIGYGVTIMSNVKIGQGAIIAAGAVVTKDVPPYAIVGGVPAKIIKYKFDKETIDELMKIDYSILKKEDIENNIEILYSPVADIDVKHFVGRIGERELYE